MWRDRAFHDANKKRLDVKDDADHRQPANSRHQTEQQQQQKKRKLLKTKIGANEGLLIESVFQSTVCYGLNVNCFKGLILNWCQCVGKWWNIRSLGLLEKVAYWAVPWKLMPRCPLLPSPPFPPALTWLPEGKHLCSIPPFCNFILTQIRHKWWIQLIMDCNFWIHSWSKMSISSLRLHVPRIFFQSPISNKIWQSILFREGCS